jgi:hypothetical protein
MNGILHVVFVLELQEDATPWGFQTKWRGHLWTHLYEGSNVIFSRQIRVSLNVYYVGLLPYLSEKWTSKYQILTSIKFSIRNIVSYSRELSWPLQTGYSPSGDDDRGKTYRSCQKHQSLSLHNLPTGRHLLEVLFISSLKSNICSANTAEIV